MQDGLPVEMLQSINAILDRALAQARDMLFEHEVYAILDALGLPTPLHRLVTCPSDITPELLSQFGSRKVVLKAAAAGLAHKQASGGVQIVYKDTELLRYMAERMSTAFAQRGTKLSGILLVEWVDYSPELGNEVLLGFRESESFGPVISFSKGGGDAEFFAEHFSGPNLILAPMDRQWARALLESAHIHRKYVSQGHAHYIDAIVEAGVQLSRLAMTFSNYADSGSRHVIREFEINPFVFTTEGRFVALDGLARFGARAGPPIDLSLPPKESMRSFFEPKGIAVAGVSTTDSGKVGNIILANLLKLGRSDVHAVNPKGGGQTATDRKVPLARRVTEIDGPVDLAIVCVPAEAALPVVRDCARKGVRAVILIPGGFSEVDRHQDVEHEIMALAREHGFRLMGPNCLGIIYAPGPAGPGINSFFIPEEKFTVDFKKETRVALLSQSGALGIIEIENLKNAISPKVIVSYGNQLDVDPADLVNYFQDDPLVDVIGCYIEGFKPGGGRRFFNVAAASRKPVIVYKAGRTPAGRKATESHTASIAGEYAVAKAALKQAGLIVADTMIDHGDLIKTFALLNGFKVHGNRVAVVANAGYEKTLAADHLGQLGIAELDAATRDALGRILPPMARPDPLLDITPMADEAVFEGCIAALLSSDAVDALLISIVPQSALIQTTDAEIEQNPDNIAARIVRLVHEFKKPTVASINVISRADAVYNALGKKLDEGGVPTFLTANRAMFCLNAFVRYCLARRTGRRAEWLM